MNENNNLAETSFNLVVATSLIILGLFNPTFIDERLNDIFLPLGVGMLFPVVLSFWKNWKRIELICHCMWLSLWGVKIRFSMSYLYIIRIEDKYLLVRSSNFKHQYQLVGGKYKFNDSAMSKLDELEATADVKLKRDGVAKNDLALFVPAKNAIKFLDWFSTQKGREVSHWREFYEELLCDKKNILSDQKFKFIEYNYLTTVKTPIMVTSYWEGCKEILQYDVLELIPNAEQLIELKSLQEKGDTEYVRWADRQLIMNLGYNNHDRETKYNIGIHTKWAINQKYSKQ